MAILRTRRASGRTVEFCESCSQACTPACRAAASRDRTRNEVFYGLGVLR